MIFKKYIFITLLFVLISNSSNVEAANTRLSIVENNTTYGGFIKGRIFANSFNLTNNSYLFEIKLYLKNSSFFNETVYGSQLIPIDLRDSYNNSHPKGLYSPDSSEGLIKKFNITVSNSDEINEKWITKAIEPIYLERGMYYLYVNLDSGEAGATKVKWYHSNSSDDNSNVAMLIDGDWDYFSFETDFSLILNISTSPINTSASAENINTYYDYTTRLNVDYIDFLGNKIHNATLKYNIPSLNLSGIMEDSNGDGTYSKDINFDQIGIFLVNYTLNRSEFLSTYTCSLIDVSQRPSFILIDYEKQIMRGDRALFWVRFIDNLSQKNIANAKLKYQYSVYSENLTIKDQMYLLNLSIVEEEGEKSITFFANKSNYEYKIATINFEIFSMNLQTKISGDRLLLYYENPHTTQNIRNLNIHVKIYDKNGSFIASDVLDETNNYGYYVLNLDGLIPEGNYSLETLTYNNNELIKRQYDNITYSQGLDNKNDSDSPKNNLMIIILITISIIVISLFGFIKFRNKKDMNIDEYPKDSEAFKIMIEHEEKEKELKDMKHGFERLPEYSQKIIKKLDNTQIQNLNLGIPQDRYSVGINSIDLLFEKGIPKKSTVLSISPVCDEKELLIESIILNNLDKTSCIYIGQIVPTYLEKYLENENFYAILTEDSPKRERVSHSDSGPTSINLSLTKISKEVKTEEKIVIFDILSDFVSIENIPILESFIYSLKKKAKEKNMSILSFVNVNVDLEAIDQLAESFDGDIEIYERPKKSIAIKKFSCINHSTGKFRLKKDKKGKLKVIF